jgi:two-component system response regulator PilR (NtrC family)
MQVKLLRAIQEKNIRPVGASIEVPVDVRILSATHKDLSALVNDGRFRHDLYYRINVIELPVPPLRERREDIPLIAAEILKRLALEMGDAESTLSPEALEALSAYPFPGNVRELENILERAMAMADGACIDLGDLGLPTRNASSTSSAAAVQARAAVPATSGAESDEGMDPDAALPEALLHVERERIRKALEACRYNKTRTAAHLGITFRALRYKLKKLGIE